MGNSLSPDGIKTGTRITKECVRCQAQFECWSDDTITIKGPVHPRTICDACSNEESQKFNPFENFEFGRPKDQ